METFSESPTIFIIDATTEEITSHWSMGNTFAMYHLPKCDFGVTAKNEGRTKAHYMSSGAAYKLFLI